MRTARLALCPALLAGLLVPALSGHADPAYSFTSAPLSLDNPLSLGFAFTMKSSALVDSLGVFDPQNYNNGGVGGGLKDDHNVGIFDSLGNLIASANVAAGSVDPVHDYFRYVNLPVPVALVAGQTYTLAATTGDPGKTDAWAYGFTNSFTGLQINSAIDGASVQSRYLYQSDNTLRDPMDYAGYKLYAGPNMQFAAPVPEAGTLAGLGGMLVLGGLAVARGRRRR